MPDKAHRQFWQALRKQNLRVDAFEGFLRSTATDTMEPIVERLPGKQFLLAATVGVEPDTAALIHSHATEQIEHMAVS